MDCKHLRARLAANALHPAIINVNVGSNIGACCRHLPPASRSPAQALPGPALAPWLSR